MKFYAAAAQFYPVVGNVRLNLEKMETLFLDIVTENKDVKLIVMPELANTGYECGSEFFSLSETPRNSKSIKRMSKLCSEYRVHLVFGFAEQGSTRRDILYNSSAVIDDNGDLIGCYRKVHLFAGEKNHFRAGCSFPLWRTKLGKFGVFICWDAAFPEPARIYAIKGAEFLILCSNYEKPYQKDWDLMTAARAFDNTLYLISSNRYGKDRNLDFFGRSRILDPLGNLIASIDEEKEGYIIQEIDTDLSVKLRQEYYTLLKDRRPDTYEDLISRY